MHRDERRNRCARDERHVARQHDDGAVGIDLRGGRLDGAAGAVGLRLDDAGDGLAARKPAFEGVGVRVDDDDSVGAGAERGGDRPADERAPAERVEHLRKLGAHARALAGGEDDGGEGGHRHTIGAATSGHGQARVCASGPSQVIDAPDARADVLGDVLHAAASCEQTQRLARRGVVEQRRGVRLMACDGAVDLHPSALTHQRT